MRAHLPKHPTIRSPPRRPPPMLPSNARPLFASIASGVSITAAITIAGIAAVAAFETAADGAAPNRDHTTGVFTLADVPRPNLRPIALGPYATGALAVLAGQPSSAPDTRAAPLAAKSPSAAPQRASGAPQPGLTELRRAARGPPRRSRRHPQPRQRTRPPRTPIAPPQPPAARRKRAVRTSDSTPARAPAAGPTRGRRDASGRGRGTAQSATGQTEPSSHASRPGRRATRGQRPDRARENAVGHRGPVVAPERTEPPAPSTAPPASPPGHANGHGEHADPPGADRGRTRGR